MFPAKKMEIHTDIFINNDLKKTLNLVRNVL